MKTCERAVYALLSSFAGGRVYAMRAPQNATAPFIVFQRISGDRWRSINAPSGVAQALMQVDAYAETFYGAKDLASQIEAALDGYRGDVLYGTNSPQDSLAICGITWQNETDLFDQTDEPFLFRVSSNFLITYEV
jgi:hypothetical protein